MFDPFHLLFLWCIIGRTLAFIDWNTEIVASKKEKEEALNGPLYKTFGENLMDKVSGKPVSSDF